MGHADPMDDGCMTCAMNAKALADARAEIERLKREVEFANLFITRISDERDSHAVRISSLEADCALLGAEVAKFRLACDNYTGDVRIVYGQAGHIASIVDARKATDASPTASAWVKGTQ